MVPVRSVCVATVRTRTIAVEPERDSSASPGELDPSRASRAAARSSRGCRRRRLACVAGDAPGAREVVPGGALVERPHGGAPDPSARGVAAGVASSVGLAGRLGRGLPRRLPACPLPAHPGSCRSPSASTATTRGRGGGTSASTAMSHTRRRRGGVAGAPAGASAAARTSAGVRLRRTGGIRRVGCGAPRPASSSSSSAEAECWRSAGSSAMPAARISASCAGVPGAPRARSAAACSRPGAGPAMAVEAVRGRVPLRASKAIVAEREDVGRGRAARAAPSGPCTPGCRGSSPEA